MKSLKSILAATALGIIALNPFSQAKAEEPKLLDAKALAHPYIETTWASDYVSGSGSKVNGEVWQQFVNLDLNNRLSLQFFQNYSFNEGAINERDYCISWNQPIKNTPLSISTGFQGWTYPTGSFGEFDLAATASLKYSGIVDAKACYTHVFWDAARKDGDQLHFKVSKTFPLIKKKDWAVTLTPSVSTALLNNWYGTSGPAHATVGATLGVSKGRFSVNATINHQESLNDKVQSFNWGQVSAGFAF